MEDIKRAGDLIRNAMAAARGLEVFFDEHFDHRVRVSEGEAKAYCPLCRFVWTPADGAEPVRFDGRPGELAA